MSDLDKMIVYRLDSIDTRLEKMESKLDEHSEKLAEMKVKWAFVSGGIAMIVSVGIEALHYFRS